LVMATQPPATAVSNSAFSTAPAVRLRDAAGNNVSQAGVSISAAVTGGGASLIGTTGVATNGSGVSTFTGLGIDGGGTFTITFGAGGLTSVVSSSVAVSETATKLGMVIQPALSAQSGQTLGTQPSVRLLSAGDNPVSQAGVTVTVGIGTGPGGATLIGTASAVTNASGVASFTNLGISGTVGSYTLAFSSSGLTAVSSGAINLTAGAAAKLIVTTQPSSPVSSGSPLSPQPVVQVADAQNNPVSSAGVLVTASASASGTLGGTITATSNAFGVAGFSDLTVSGVMGDVFTITFSATGLTSASTGSLTFGFFDIRTQPREAASLTQADEMLLVESAFGTKAVVVHTLGLRTFSRGSGRFAGSQRVNEELPVALHFIALNQP
jgi:hypothetical protein